jgi:Tripartite tricarboxylate transporter TctB family
MLNLSSKTRRDTLGGILMVLLGVGAVIEGQLFRVGTLARMGPGFFPVAVGVILAAVGVLIVIAARLSAPSESRPALPAEWWSWLLICLSIVSFVVVGTYGGLVPATIAIVAISAFADRTNTIKGTLVLSLALTIVAVVVFWWLLKMQLPLFRWG